MNRNVQNEKRCRRRQRRGVDFLVARKTQSWAGDSKVTLVVMGQTKTQVDYERLNVTRRGFLGKQHDPQKRTCVLHGATYPPKAEEKTSKIFRTNHHSSADLSGAPETSSGDALEVRALSPMRRICASFPDCTWGDRWSGSEELDLFAC